MDQRAADSGSEAVELRARVGLDGHAGVGSVAGHRGREDIGQKLCLSCDGCEGGGNGQGGETGELSP